MDPIAKSAFLIAQAAILNARIATMQASNLERADVGMAPAYGEQQFTSVQMEFPHLEYNNALAWLRE